MRARPLHWRHKLAMARLQDLRRQKPLTQAELASVADVSIATIRNIENGYYADRQLRPRTIRALATALAIDPADIDEFRASLGLPTRPKRKPRGR